MSTAPLTAEHKGRPGCRPAATPSRVLADRMRGPKTALAAAMVSILSAAVPLAPSALADPEDTLRAAMQASRAGSSCGPFGSDSTVQRVAEVVNKSVTDWLDHKASHVPIEDPLPGLKELGYRGSKGVTFQGVSDKSQADAIKGALLEGYTLLPDCSYTDLGVSMLLNERTGENLAAVVLAGP